MKYSAAFLATLRPEGRNILRRGPQKMGAIPFCLQPDVGGTFSGYGAAFDDAGSAPISVATELPSGVGTAAQRRLRVRIVGGTTAGQTAGRFGMPTADRSFCTSSGWVARWITSGALAAGSNRGGDFFANNFAADGTFQPHRAIAGRGWTKASGDAAVWTFYGGTPGVTVACTGPGSAASDARPMDHVMAESRQDTSGVCTGYALKIDVSDEANPVVIDERIYTVPSPTLAVGAEFNRSATETTGGAATEISIYLFEGAHGVDSLTD